jgi:glc operon protein GlcG
MSFQKLTLALLTCVPLVVGAQAPANPADVVPEKMPFDLAYGPAVTLEQAETMLNASMAEAKRRNWKLNCAVLDSGAHLVSFKRMDGGAIASIQIAMHKARTAVKFRRDTKILELAMQNNPYIGTLDDVIASRGGLPIIDNDKLVGGIGCSGGTGSQDELVAKAGLAALGK